MNFTRGFFEFRLNLDPKPLDNVPLKSGYFLDLFNHYLLRHAAHIV